MVVVDGAGEISAFAEMTMRVGWRSKKNPLTFKPAG
jgi:hypothetical protein